MKLLDELNLMTDIICLEANSEIDHIMFTYEYDLINRGGGR